MTWRTIIVEPSQLVLEPLRTDEEFVLYRGEHSNQPVSPSVLLLAPENIEHYYSLRDEMDAGWAIRSQALSEQRGQTPLILEDPGRELLDRFLPDAMEMKQFVRFRCRCRNGSERVAQR
jgi:hypothetical protein